MRSIPDKLWELRDDFRTLPCRSDVFVRTLVTFLLCMHRFLRSRSGMENHRWREDVYLRTRLTDVECASIRTVLYRFALELITDPSCFSSLVTGYDFHLHDIRCRSSQMLFVVAHLCCQWSPV